MESASSNQFGYLGTEGSTLTTIALNKGWDSDKIDVYELRNTVNYMRNLDCHWHHWLDLRGAIVSISFSKE